MTVLEEDYTKWIVKCIYNEKAYFTISGNNEYDETDFVIEENKILFKDNLSTLLIYVNKNIDDCGFDRKNLLKWLSTIINSNNNEFVENEIETINLDNIIQWIQEKEYLNLKNENFKYTLHVLNNLSNILIAIDDCIQITDENELKKHYYKINGKEIFEIIMNLTLWKSSQEKKWRDFKKLKKIIEKPSFLNKFKKLLNTFLILHYEINN